MVFRVAKMRWFTPQRPKEYKGAVRWLGRLADLVYKLDCRCGECGLILVCWWLRVDVEGQALVWTLFLRTCSRLTSWISKTPFWRRLKTCKGCTKKAKQDRSSTSRPLLLRCSGQDQVLEARATRSRNKVWRRPLSSGCAVASDHWEN